MIKKKQTRYSLLQLSDQNTPKFCLPNLPSIPTVFTTGTFPGVYNNSHFKTYITFCTLCNILASFC